VGTTGFHHARDVACRPPWIILEVGYARDRAPGEETSTAFLARLGPPVHVIDVDPEAVAHASSLDNVTAHLGRAEDVLRRWNSDDVLPPVGFAWLDGHDWPYAHAEAADPDVYVAQKAAYLARGQAYSRAASAASHLAVAVLLEPHLAPGSLVALDDTWALPSPLDDAPGPGWSGKGGTAVPHLLERGFTLLVAGDIHHGYVLLRRDGRPLLLNSE
jgi:hypothetical protein